MLEKIEHYYPNIHVHYTTCVLESGLTLIYYEKKGFNRFILDVGINYGARVNAIINDNLRHDITKGLAHYLEHKMFTLRDGSDAAIGFDHLSLNNNAMTGYHSTQYYCGGIRHFKEGLSYLLNMVLATPLLNQTTYLKELPIITEEIDMYRNIPESELENGLNKCLFNDYYLACDVAGTTDTIKHITPEELAFINDTLYVPANMVLIIVGDLATCYGDSLDHLCDCVNTLTLPYTKPLNMTLDDGYHKNDNGLGPQEEPMNVGLLYSAIGFKKDITGLTPRQRNHLFDILNVIMLYYFGENSSFMDSLRQKGIIYNGDFSIDVSEHFLVISVKAMGSDIITFKTEAGHLLSSLAEKPLTLAQLEPTIKEIIGSRINDLEDDESVIDLLISDTFEHNDTFKDYLYVRDITLDDIEKGLKYFISPDLKDFTITPSTKPVGK